MTTRRAAVQSAWAEVHKTLDNTHLGDRMSLRRDAEDIINALPIRKLQALERLLRAVRDAGGGKTDD